MSISLISSPAAIKKRFPLTERSREFLNSTQNSVKKIIDRTDKRRALIIGPCSIHDKVSALDYAKRFKTLAEKVRDSCFLIMRAYCEKSRTSTGWKGFLYDPYLNGSQDLATGLIWTRELFLLLTEWNIPLAVEFVDPLVASYFDDLITWGFIGARTCASQPHRQFASGLSIPIGFKNSTDGNLDHAIHAVAVSNIGHTFLCMNEDGQLGIKRTCGNPYSHVVLRGADGFTNYDAVSIWQASQKMEEIGLQSKIIIDCSHGNCQRQFHKQTEVFLDVLHQIEQGNDAICGIMLESHLESGFQHLENPHSLKYAVSITDPCIDWDTTESLIYSAHRRLSGCLAPHASILL